MRISINNYLTELKVMLLNLDTISLISASIPYSFYNVSTNNNQFRINSTTYTLTPQNYTITSLVNALNGLLTNTTFKFTANFASLKLVLSSTSNLPVTFNALNMGILLGFSSNTNFIGNGALTGNICFDILNGVRSIYIRSPNLSIDESKENDIEYLYAIPINVNYGNLITYNPTYKIEAKLNTKLTKVINLQILDNLGRELDLNGCRFHIEFDITVKHTIINRADLLKTLEEIITKEETET